jgi:F0F1-type ATP synthase assembly protein I
LNCAPPAAILDGVITMYRAYRDSWRALELRRPLVSDLIRGAAVMLGFVVGAVLQATSLTLGMVIGGLIGVAVAVGWRHHRRSVSVHTG